MENIKYSEIKKLLSLDFTDGYHFRLVYREFDFQINYIGNDFENDTFTLRVVYRGEKKYFKEQKTTKQALRNAIKTYRTWKKT